MIMNPVHVGTIFQENALKHGTSKNCRDVPVLKMLGSEDKKEIFLKRFGVMF